MRELHRGVIQQRVKVKATKQASVERQKPNDARQEEEEEASLSQPR